MDNQVTFDNPLCIESAMFNLVTCWKHLWRHRTQSREDGFALDFPYSTGCSQSEARRIYIRAKEEEDRANR